VRGRLIALSVLAGIIIPATTALAAPPSQPTPGSAGIGIRLVGSPADSDNNPLARSYVVDRLAPGTSIRRRVEISNSTSSSAAVAVYPAAAALRRGNFTFAPGRSKNDLSSWTSVSRGALRLAPGAKAFETLTMNVPEDASPGERYAVIWAEVSNGAPAAGGVTLVNRVGVRMYLSIGPGGTLPSSFAIGSLTAERSKTGEPLVVANVHNNGRRTLEISGALTLSKGPGGLRAGPFAAKLGTALPPGGSDLATVRLDKRLPRGPWRAQLRLRSGSIERTIAATITFPLSAGVGKPPAARVVPPESGNLIPVVISVLVLLAIAALALGLSRRVRRGRGHVRRSAPAPH
jgi:hypothetical protein